MRGLKFGQYTIGETLIHRLDPRIKITACFLIIFSTLFVYRWPVIVLNLAVIVYAIYLSGSRARLVFHSIWRLWLLFLLTFIFQSLLTEGETILALGGLAVTREGVALGVFTILRLVILLLTSCLLTATTSPIQLAAGLEAVFVPLGVFKVPVHQFSMVISTALRFIPEIIQEAETLAKAQKSRGAPLNSPRVLEKVKGGFAVLIPLLANSLQRADDLAVAMESRCYTGGANRTRIFTLRLERDDYLVTGVMAAMFAFSLFIARL